MAIVKKYTKYHSPFKVKLKKKTVANLAGILVGVISALTFISHFFQAPLLSVFKSFFGAAFGWLLPVFSLIGVGLAAILIGVKLKFVSFNQIVGAAVFFAAVLGLTKPFFQNAAGILGRSLWEGIAQLITGVGAVLVLVAIAVGGLVIFLNTSLDQVVSVFWQLVSTIVAYVKKFLWRKPAISQAEIKLGPTISSTTTAAATPVVAGVQPKEPKTGETILPAGSDAATLGQIWQYPSLSILSETSGRKADRGDIKVNATIIEKTLAGFGIAGKVVEVNLGPAVTQYAIAIPLGTKISKITSLANDLALALATATGTVRIEAPIPGKSLIGIEIPNRSLEVVSLRSILASEVIQHTKSKLVVALGKDVAGNAVVADISKMPHVLIAGATGSGKSVLLNAFISSILFRAAPFEVKLILVDPKRVELSDYNDIPHLLTPVIVDLEKILSSLKWTIAEMDRRYKLFAQAQVRNIAGYNEAVGFAALPYIVVVIDELADLMSFAPVEVEDAIIRLAQMARATGIHLVIVTQRPSVDVITGLIKANITCRISFNVASMVDSKVIIDQPGAEKLLGRGDMLYLPPDAAKPSRIQGVYVSDSEIASLISHLKASKVAPEYISQVTEMPIIKAGRISGEQDELFEESVRTICQYDRASASLLQRRLRVGYARAARLLDELEAAGIVGPGEGAKPRDVLVRNAEEFLSRYQASPSS